MHTIATVVMIALCLAHPEAEVQRSGRAASVEDIYVARSLRLSRGTPTDFCAQSRTGFGNATYEDRYAFHATATRPSDGRMTNTKMNTIGHLRACFGSTADPLVLNFYAEGDLGAVSFTGKGECRGMRQDFPEPGITPFRCFLELTDLPRGYAGGQLTTNSVVSREAIGENSDPRGYTQPSIATVRLWKRR